MIFFFLFITLIFVSNFPKNIVATNNIHHHKHHHNHHHKGHKASLLETACQRARDKDACVSALGSDPNARGSDLKGLVLIALRLASSNASDVSEHLKVLLNNDTSLSPAQQDGASECLEHYLDAAEQLEDSTAALLADAHNDVETWVGVAVTDADSCDSALAGHAQAVMGDKGEAFRRLCDYALVINKLLAEQKNKN